MGAEELECCPKCMGRYVRVDSVKFTFEGMSETWEGRKFKKCKITSIILTCALCGYTGDDAEFMEVV